MTVAQTGVIDWLGIDNTGHVCLAVVDDLDWSDEHDHLLILQETLNTHLAFIESGEFFERLVEELTVVSRTESAWCVHADTASALSISRCPGMARPHLRTEAT
ncbi:DUF6572 domain-containing protein [Steroidobacter gossypii]|uniref:DUF6572 domain-containing protein n=1 Tax=Steroidobacter gossypii TaxID=2805490 RepID=UPI003899904F